MLSEDPEARHRITPTLMFVGEVCGRAGEAIDLYTSVFPGSRVGDVAHYGPEHAPNTPGTVMHGSFVVAQQRFAAMDSALDHDFAFNEAISFMVPCDTQEEIDHVWAALSAVPEAEQCGWLEDRYGVSWQIVPSALNEMLRNATEQQRERVTQAFLAMKKFDLAELQRAYEGTSAHAER